MKRFCLLVLCVLLAAAAAGCAQQIFDGSSTGNNKRFVLEYSVLNKTITHELVLEQGTVIDVDIENISGRIDILITGPDGEKVYKGDAASSGSFSIEAKAAGTYNITVKGRNAKGSVSFVAEE